MLLRSRPGFTLVEVVLAAFIFAVGVLALEAAAASSLQRMRRSSQLTLAGSVARSRLEMLAGSRCSDISGGTDTVRFIVSAWTVAPVARPSLRAVTQTISYDVDGAQRQDNYVSVVPCSE